MPTPLPCARLIKPIKLDQERARGSLNSNVDAAAAVVVVVDIGLDVGGLAVLVQEAVARVVLVSDEDGSTSRDIAEGGECKGGVQLGAPWFGERLEGYGEVEYCFSCK